MRRLLIAVLLFMAVTNTASAELNSEQILAKTQGITFYNQYKATSAMPFLTIAAEAGDHEAQYYLGESLRRKNHYMNPEARRWYEASAAQGDLYAMIQLGRSEKDLCKFTNDCSPNQKLPIEWLNQAKDVAMPKTIQGDVEAMYIMYELTGDEEWLEKSALAGHALAQYWMGVSSQQGEGFFLPWKRGEAIEKWFKASAEGGYPKSMMEYAAILFEKSDIKGFRYWNEQAALAGYASTVYGYGSDLAHEPDTYGFPFNIVKGYALIYLLRELDGGGGILDLAESKLQKIASKMTPEQIVEAEKFAKTWKATHAPMSFFPDKLSR
ncbi:tetratricopeptide repeat protein [Pseudomonas frederiksbergensis]|uniref:tetratricopeptide repeat protein n=1 Tax=Pseudomonas frederiksbergensis TaxID=104087 RepID=UPI003D07CFF2